MEYGIWWHSFTIRAKKLHLPDTALICAKQFISTCRLSSERKNVFFLRYLAIDHHRTYVVLNDIIKKGHIKCISLL